MWTTSKFKQQGRMNSEATHGKREDKLSLTQKS